MFRWMGVLAGCLLLSSCINNNPTAPIEKISRVEIESHSGPIHYHPGDEFYLTIISVNGTLSARNKVSIDRSSSDGDRWFGATQTYLGNLMIGKTSMSIPLGGQCCRALLIAQVVNGKLWLWTDRPLQDAIVKLNGKMLITKNRLQPITNMLSDTATIPVDYCFVLESNYTIYPCEKDLP